MNDIIDTIDINITDIASQEVIDYFLNIADSINMSDNNDIEFHKYALRIPKEIFKTIEDIAWENRTSVNIQIIDLLLFALYKLDQKHFEALFNLQGEYSFFTDEETGEEIEMVGKDRLSEIKEIFRSLKNSFTNITNNPVEAEGLYKILIEQYPQWRNKR